MKERVDETLKFLTWGTVKLLTKIKNKGDVNSESKRMRSLFKDSGNRA